MPKRCVTVRNYAIVLERLVNYISEQNTEGKLGFCYRLDMFLDELCSEDAFGTEAQCDPRGDQRD